MTDQTDESLQGLWDNYNRYACKLQKEKKKRERERKKKRKTEEIFETKIDNFSKLISDTRPKIQEAHSVARTSPSI